MIIVDVETTGLNPKENSIVSIGAVDLSDPKRQFYIENRIWNGAAIYLGNGLLGYQPALSINGFSLEEINDGKKPALDEAMMKFINWAKECKGLLFDQSEDGRMASIWSCRMLYGRSRSVFAEENKRSFVYG